LQQVEAGKPDGPSEWSTWAPVVGSFLGSDMGGNLLESAWDWVFG